MESIFDIYIWVIFFSALLGAFVYFRKGTPFHMVAFTINLFIIFFIECYASWLSSRGYATVTLYNIFSTLEVVFFIWLIRNFLNNKKNRFLLSTGLCSYPFLVMINKLWLQKGVQFHTITMCLGCLFIVIAAILYFYEIFQSSGGIRLAAESSFWICSGLLFFYAISLPIWGVTNIIVTPSNFFVRNMFIILNMVNILLYSAFSMASICRIKIRKYS